MQKDPERDPREFDDDDGSDLNLILVVGSGIVIAAVALIFLIVVFLHPFSGSRTASESASESTRTEAQNQVEVPNIVGMTEDEAEETLSALNLGIKYKGEQYSEQEAGIIISQSPEAGSTASVNDTVTYIRSGGTAKMAMPALSGMTLAEAKQLLENKGFTHIETEYTRSSDQIGYVISSSPAESAKVTTTDTILLTVSSGVISQSARPGSYIGMTLSEAAAQAAEDGLIADFHYGKSSLVESGQVMKQDLDPYTPVASGSVIDLTICESAPADSDYADSSADRTVNLGQPDNYRGGSVRFVLEQTVSDTEYEILLQEETAPTFPYRMTVPSIRGAEGGLIRLYEQNGEEWTRIASWELPEK